MKFSRHFNVREFKVAIFRDTLISRFSANSEIVTMHLIFAIS